MKNKILNFSIAAMAALSLSSCNDWLTEDAPGNQKFDDFFTGGAMAEQVVNGAYVPLAWEYNNSYFSEWFFGDIGSDDALKGGAGHSRRPRRLRHRQLQGKPQQRHSP